MFTGTEFLIGIGVLVVISAIASIFMLKKPYKPWEYHDITKKPIINDTLFDPAYKGTLGNIFNDD